MKRKGAVYYQQSHNITKQDKCIVIYSGIDFHIRHDDRYTLALVVKCCHFFHKDSDKHDMK